MTTKKTFFALILSAMIFVPFTISAQITIGSGNPPSEWSLLYLDASEQRKALHNARMTTPERDALVPPVPDGEQREPERGLMIFNITNNCLEYWNGVRWVSLCENRLLWLRVNPGTWTFLSGGGIHTFDVDTNARTWSVDWINADGTPTSSPDGFTLGTPDFTNNTFTVTAADNTGAMRIGIIAVTAGGLTRQVVVMQEGTDASSTVINAGAFVGAFWRNEQRGERLIRIPHNEGQQDAVWTAFATEDWIQLDRELPWEMTGNEYLVCMTTQDHLHRLPADAGGTVSGRGHIYFRIGLDSYNENPVNPRNRTPQDTNGREPRWGQVILVHSEGTHIIWIRQGEDTAELMRVGDAGNENTLRTTDNIITFSPFNLTGQTLGQQVNVRGGIFVTYPTQTGAFWQFGGFIAAVERMPWNPVTPPPGNSPSGWVSTDIPGNWYTNATTQNLAAHHETCPLGFRRPRDGHPWGDKFRFNNTIEEIHQSEIRQSLFLFPQISTIGSGDDDPQGPPTSNLANSVWGFYADGFFDRREPTNATGVVVNRTDASTVAAGTTEIAHQGALFFNAESGASLFFPAAGFRFHSTNTFLGYGPGYLHSIGNRGMYLTSTQGNGRHAMGVWRLDLRSNLRYMDGENTRAHGFSIRCVAE